LAADSFLHQKTGIPTKLPCTGLEILNLLIANEGTHDQVLKLGEAKILEKSSAILHMLEKEKTPTSSARRARTTTLPQERMALMRQMIQERQDPIKIIVKKIMDTNSTLIMNEATKALSSSSVTDEVLHRLK